MMKTGTEVDVEHCQHCKPRVWWLENEPGKAPQLAYSEFPKDGQIVLSNNRVIVVCRKCSPAVEVFIDAAKSVVELSPEPRSS